MGTKKNPGKFDCYNKAEPDEPVFILLARDKAAPELVREWAMKRSFQINIGLKPASDREMVREALQCADAMEAWRRVNRR